MIVKHVLSAHPEVQMPTHQVHLQDAQDCKLMLVETLHLLKVASSAATNSVAQLQATLKTAQELVQHLVQSHLVQSSVTESGGHQQNESTARNPAVHHLEVQFAQQLATLQSAADSFDQHASSCKQMLRSVRRMADSVALRSQADEAAGSAVKAAAYVAHSQCQVAAAQSAAAEMRARAQQLRKQYLDVQADIADAQADQLQQQAEDAAGAAQGHLQDASAFSRQASCKDVQDDQIAHETQLQLACGSGPCHHISLSLSAPDRAAGRASPERSAALPRDTTDEHQAPSDDMPDGASMAERSCGLQEVSLAAAVSSSEDVRATTNTRCFQLRVCEG